jgi:hypothetical protein
VISWSLINRIRIKPIKDPAQRTSNVHFIAILPLKAIPLHKLGQIPGDDDATRFRIMVLDSFLYIRQTGLFRETPDVDHDAPHP